MQPSERAAQARRELDRQLRAADLESIHARPRSGWIRAIREALMMSQAVLARRLGISPIAVGKLERAEVRGGITVSKLEEVATALNCTLVYAFIPRSTLERSVLDQARATAAETIRYTARTMELEDQAADDDYLREVIERKAQELVRRGDIWGTR